MPLALSTAGLSDGPAYAETYVSVFYDEELHAKIYRDLSFDKQVEETEKLWPGFASSPTSFTQLVKDTETGETVSLARWAICNSENLAKKLNGLDVDLSTGMVASARHPEGIDQELAARCLAAVKETRDKFMGDGPYMHLCLLGTKSGHYRRGAGGILLKWMGDFADKEGVPCWVESTKMGKPVYEKHGFVTKDTLEMSFEGGETTHYGMRRDPRC
ncbi:hypothetical protein MKZ38_004683 [Zalerion maritima]|uniref:N-acetyltransferase domain-containing protein n=1 Tax=Zalerion maritima TaxID=339359 RepID=A0AAD5RL97_9PEZI|nr:hypothetical protein MKZ38_004683 [Zalerion maritima]